MSVDTTGFDIDLYHKKVEEIFEGLRKEYPRNDPKELRGIAEERAVHYLPQDYGDKRLH